MTRSRLNNFFLILTLGALTTISPLAIDMYLAAFPQMATDLHTTVSQVALSLSSYFIGLSVGQLLYGPVLDRYGRKKPIYFGLAIFLLASIACLRSVSVEELIAFRLLQALGGCVAGVAATAMVRDFFPVQESAKVFSLLMLVLSVSPLLAPSIGTFIVLQLGWPWVFVTLAAIVAVILAVVALFLPEGHPPDPSISLRPVPILKNFIGIFCVPQFFTYALSGSLSFAGLFVYVAGSPIIFMEYFQVSAKFYGGIFAFLAVGFIGAGQVNILLTRKFSAAQVYPWALRFQVVLAALFVLGTATSSLGLYGTIAMQFLYMGSIGMIYPNAAALALAPFSQNAGSAAALLGFLQIGVGALASTALGFFDGREILPIISIFVFSSSLAWLAYRFGKKKLTSSPAATEPAPSFH